jgi:COP9 signalosome complex subunit 1
VRSLSPVSITREQASPHLAPLAHSSADVPKLDIDSYIQNYSSRSLPRADSCSRSDIPHLGRTRFERLYFVGTHSTVLGPESLKAAVIEAKLGREWERYNQAAQALGTIAPQEPEAVLDHTWSAALTKRNKHDTEQLEAQLKGYKNNLIKESTRVSTPPPPGLLKRHC